MSVSSEQQAWTSEFLYIEGEVKLQDEFTRDALFYSVGSLLVHASRLSAQASRRNKNGVKDRLYLFQELIEKNFLLLKTPKDYAAKMNITANYLNALCKEKSGKSAGELIRQRVLLEAKGHWHIRGYQLQKSHSTLALRIIPILEGILKNTRSKRRSHFDRSKTNNGHSCIIQCFGHTLSIL